MDPEKAVREALSEDARIRFEALYERQGSWDVERVQPAFLTLADRGAVRGSVLDVGCGTGDNALYFASRGHDTWGIDIVAGAIARARSKSRALGLPFGRFLVADALALEEFELQFDTVIDSGFFHALSNRERPFFLRGLRKVLRCPGTYHLLGFSDRQPGDTGPRRLSEVDLRATFRDGWRVLSIEPALFETNIHPGGAQAWLASFELRA